jgi:D-glycerate 3-kinase
MSVEQRLLRWCADQQRTGHRPVIGLNGPVGAGKSTLSRQLQAGFAREGLRLAVASIDDAYLPWQARLEAMAGNPYGVNRVPPGSHDPAGLVVAIRAWRQAGGARLQLPRFDKTLRQGAGDRVSAWIGEADALLLEGWLLGCWPLPGLQLDVLTGLKELEGFSAAELGWVLRCNQALEAYLPLWAEINRLVMLWPLRWSLPRRWRLQAEAKQRREGGGWLSASKLESIVKATLQSLPPSLYQQPVLAQANEVRVLDGRRRCVWEGSGEAALTWLDQSCSDSSSATGYTKP